MENKKYICKYCKKEFDNPYKLGGHIRRCKLNPNYKEIIKKWKISRIFKNSKKINYFNKEQILYCQYCNKECKSLNSLKQHERLCKENPEHIDSSFINYNKTREPINQYIKAKKLNLPKPQLTVESKEKISNNWKGKNIPIKMKRKIQNTIQEKIENNNWHNNNGIKIKYNNEIFDSSWEVSFVKFLDNKNIKWERPKKSFNYIWENSIHKYYPDIYLPKYNLYIEIKGLPNEKDYCKWLQFNGNLDIYDSLDLFNLGIINKIDNRNLIKEEFRKKHVNLGSVV